MSKLCLIVAISSNHQIGLNGKLPWDIPEDLLHFKRTTMGYPCIMGRNTYHDIGRPLPGRRCIVITSDEIDHPAVEVARSLDDAIALAKQDSPEKIFVIGGAALYEQAITRADAIHLTRVHAHVKGDRELRLDLKPHLWQKVSATRIVSIAGNADNKWMCDFEYWQRR
jgi:dihydrofolate reductase